MKKSTLFLLLVIFISSCQTSIVQDYFIVKEVHKGYNNFNIYTIELETYYGLGSNPIWYSNNRVNPGDTIYLTKLKP